MHRITSLENVLVVEILGTATLEDVIAAIRDENSRPDYTKKNDIFIFSKELFEAQIDQLDLVTQYILENYPSQTLKRKTAIVVPDGFNMSVVELWLTGAEQLPYELKAFSSLKAAEDWTSQLVY